VNSIVNFFYLLSYLIIIATTVISALLLLRMVVSWMGLSPFGWLSYNLRRVTEPILRPLRGSFGGPVMRFDMIPLVMAIFVLATGFFIANIVNQLGIIIGRLITDPLSLRSVTAQLISLMVIAYTVLILLRILLPMLGIGYYNKFMRFTFSVTEPLLGPLRRRFVAGMFDFSPLVAILIVQIIGWILISAIS